MNETPDASNDPLIDQLRQFVDHVENALDPVDSADAILLSQTSDEITPRTAGLQLTGEDVGRESDGVQVLDTDAASGSEGPERVSEMPRGARRARRLAAIAAVLIAVVGIGLSLGDSDGQEVTTVASLGDLDAAADSESSDADGGGDSGDNSDGEGDDGEALDAEMPGSSGASTSIPATSTPLPISSNPTTVVVAATSTVVPTATTAPATTAPASTDPTSTAPTSVPATNPTAIPTSTPATVPTSIPTAIPTSTPATVPTTNPTAIPTSTPATVPTSVPTTIPTAIPTSTPATVPTSVPTTNPTAIPTSTPTTVATSTPTTVPTTNPTAIPTSTSTAVPTSTPTTVPTTDPTAIPTSTPTPAATTPQTRTVTLTVEVPTGVPSGNLWITTTGGDPVTDFGLNGGWITRTLELPAVDLILTGDLEAPYPPDGCDYTAPVVTLPANATALTYSVATSCDGGTTVTPVQPADRTVTINIVATGDAAPALEQFPGQIMAVYSDFHDLVASIDLRAGTTSYSFPMPTGGFTISLGWQTPEDLFCYYDFYGSFGSDVTVATVELEYGCAGGAGG